MSALVLRSLRKRYGRTEALRDVDVVCAVGEVTVLLGHSGAGKTSLLRLVAGLEDADAGDIVLGGAVVNDLAPRDRDVSMAFESYALHPQRTVFDNIALPLRIGRPARRAGAGDVERRVREIAALLEIEPLLGRLPRQLSGGQRQRVALGRALVRDAAVHLLDEPIAHLDAKLRHQLHATLKRFQQERARTTVWATPDQLEALAVADRIVVLRHGAVEQVGPPDEVYGRPRNEFVATAVGDPPMNVLDARVLQNNGAWSLDVGGARLPLEAGRAEAVAGLPADGRVRVGLRPGDIAIQAAAPVGVEAEVLLYEPLGRYAVATVRALGAELKVKTSGEVEYRPRTRAWIVPNPARYYFFHPDTGRALAV